MTINSSNLGPVSVFAKFNGGFQTQSSDAVDRKRSLTTYFVDSADRDWYLDVHANNGNSTLYTFVMHGSVLTASPSLGGRTEGVIGIQFEIDGERVYSLASFASKFVDLFRNVCNDPNFFFRHSASNYFPVGSNFPATAAENTRQWLVHFLDSLASDASIENIPVPRVSEGRLLILPGTTEDAKLTEAFLETGKLRIQALVPMVVLPLTAKPSPPARPTTETDATFQTSNVQQDRNGSTAKVHAGVEQGTRPYSDPASATGDSRPVAAGTQLANLGRRNDWLGFFAASALGAAISSLVAGLIINEIADSSSKKIASLHARMDVSEDEIRRAVKALNEAKSTPTAPPTTNMVAPEKKPNDPSSDGSRARVDEKKVAAQQFENKQITKNSKKNQERKTEGGSQKKDEGKMTTGDGATIEAFAPQVPASAPPASAAASPKTPTTDPTSPAAAPVAPVPVAPAASAAMPVPPASAVVEPK